MSEPSTTSAKRLTEGEWATAKAEFELGQKTATKIAEEHGVSRQAISDGLKRRGAVYGCKSKTVEQAAIEASKSDATKRIEEIQAMREKQRKFIETTQGLGAKLLMDAMRDGVPIHQKDKDLKALKNAMAIFAVGRRELWEIYGLNDDRDADKELPEFAISEYTPEEIEAIHRRNGIDTDADIDEALSALEREALLEGQGDDPLDGLLDDEDD